MQIVKQIIFQTQLLLNCWYYNSRSFVKVSRYPVFIFTLCATAHKFVEDLLKGFPCREDWYESCDKQKKELSRLTAMIPFPMIVKTQNFWNPLGHFLALMVTTELENPWNPNPLVEYLFLPLIQNRTHCNLFDYYNIKSPALIENQ